MAVLVACLTMKYEDMKQDVVDLTGLVPRMVINQCPVVSRRRAKQSAATPVGLRLQPPASAGRFNLKLLRRAGGLDTSYAARKSKDPPPSGRSSPGLQVCPLVLYAISSAAGKSRAAAEIIDDAKGRLQR